MFPTKKKTIIIIIDFINVIGNQLIAESGDSKSKKFLFDRISLAIQRGNAASILQYYRKFLYYKTKMLCNYVINIKFHRKKILLLLTIIQCKQRYIRTSLPCNVTVENLKLFFSTRVWKTSTL
jgi:hypothetical protein